MFYDKQEDIDDLVLWSDRHGSRKTCRTCFYPRFADDGRLDDRFLCRYVSEEVLGLEGRLR